MELVKKTANYSIFKKRSGRFCIQNPQGQWIRAAEKLKILLDEKLVKMEVAKPKAEPVPTESAPTAL